MMLHHGFARRFGLVFVSASLALGLAGLTATADETAIPAKPEAGTFKIGIEPWLGYGQWHVAAKKGLFAKNGLEEVEIVNFTEDKDINAALASGQIDGANIATHTAMAMAAAGLPIKIVLLDVSHDRRRDHRRHGHRLDRRSQGQAGRLRGGHHQRHPAELRAPGQRHDDRRRQDGADAGGRCRQRADRRAGAGGGHLRALPDHRRASRTRRSSCSIPPARIPA